MFARSPGHRRGFWSSVYTVSYVIMMKTRIIITVNENNLFWDIRVFENASVWDDCHPWWKRKKEASGLLYLCSSDGSSNYTKKKLQLIALRSFGEIIRVPALCIFFFTFVSFVIKKTACFMQNMLKLHTRGNVKSHSDDVQKHLGLLWIASHIQQGHQMQQGSSRGNQ